MTLLVQISPFLNCPLVLKTSINSVRKWFLIFFLNYLIVNHTNFQVHWKTKNRFSNFDVSLKVFWFECKFLRNLLNFNTFFFTSYKQKYESASIKVKTLQIICTPSQKTLGAETNFWILMEIMQTITTKTFR